MSELPLAELGTVADVKTGRTPRGLDRYLADTLGADRRIPFYKVGDMNADHRFLKEARTYLSDRDVEVLGVEVLPPGTIVFPKAGGAIATNKKRLIATPGGIDLNCMAVVPGVGLDPRFLAAWFESFDLRSIADGSVLPQISRKRVLPLKVPVPALDQQRRIVEVLEDHLSRLDAGVAAVARQVDRLAALRQSWLQQEVDRLAAGGAPLRHIASIADTALGKMLDAKRAAGTPTRYLRNINVRWGYVDTTDVAEIPLSDRERERFALLPGDLLVCEGGDPGRCAVWWGSSSLMAYQKALHRVRVDPDVADPEFVAAMLEYFVRSGQAASQFTGTTIKHLPQEKLRRIAVHVPKIERQRLLVDGLREINDGASRLGTALDVALSRAERLRRSLLSAAFSGKLTGTPSGTERIEELVEVGV